MATVNSGPGRYVSTSTGSLRHGLHEHGKRQRQPVYVVRRVEAGERSGGDAAEGERLLGAPFVQRERERERIGAGVGDAQVLADRRNERLTTVAAEPFGHVEHEIGAGERELLR